MLYIIYEDRHDFKEKLGDITEDLIQEFEREVIELAESIIKEYSTHTINQK